MNQLPLIPDPCDPPAFNAYVSDAELRAMGWTRSVEEWSDRWGTGAQRKRKAKSK